MLVCVIFIVKNYLIIGPFKKFRIIFSEIDVSLCCVVFEIYIYDIFVCIYIEGVSKNYNVYLLMITRVVEKI